MLIISMHMRVRGCRLRSVAGPFGVRRVATTAATPGSRKKPMRV